MAAASSTADREPALPARVVERLVTRDRAEPCAHLAPPVTLAQLLARQQLEIDLVDDGVAIGGLVQNRPRRPAHLIERRPVNFLDHVFVSTEKSVPPTRIT